MDLPNHCKIVIIGGGAIGCSIAYHLAKAGERDVLLLEKSGLTHGATWHAAGLVGQLRSQQNLTRMMKISSDLFETLTAETEVEIDWKRVGSVRLASSQDRWLEIQRTNGQGRAFGLEMELLTPNEAKDIYPYLNTDGIVGAAFIPTDGYVDPSSLTQAYAKGARAGGARIMEGVLVTDVTVENGRVTRVVTDHGTITCETLVNAAGLWARQVARMAGFNLPATVVEHQYMVTEKGLDSRPDLPTLRDPDNNFYAKPEVGGLAIGGWEKDTPALGNDGLPFAFGRELFASNFDRFEDVILPAAGRIPALNELGVLNMINGPIPISADGEPILGPAPGIPNLFLACGFTSGIAASGGAGRCMADWILEGDPGMDLWAFDIRRFGPHHGNIDFVNARVKESYAKYYSMAWPADEMESARGLRRSPLYDRLMHSGAVYGSKFGWERPNWFAERDQEARDVPSFGRPNWFDNVAREHRAVRGNVVLIDQCSFSKFEIRGSGAAKFLNRLAANTVDRQPGAAVYTQLLNDRAGIEADLTIMRLAEDSFYVVTGSGFGVRDGGWIRDRLPDDGSVTMHDVSTAKGVINLSGPKAREVLEQVTSDDVSNAAFPYMSCHCIEIGGAPVLAIRLTYVGELGWELHMPIEFTAHVFGLLREAGRPLGITNAGYRAIDSLRMEKRYVYWGADVSPDYTPLEAGLGFCVGWKKDDFVGRDALLRQRDAGVERTLACFLLDQPGPAYGGEPIYADGRIAGVTTSANFGHSMGKDIALGYIPTDLANTDDFTIECFGDAIPAAICPSSPYDPNRWKIVA